MIQAELLLVRHGQTDWNIAYRYQGQIKPGPSLNSEGRAQAVAAARKLAGVPAQALYTSDLARALETAQIIGQALGLPIQVDPRLRETNMGHWQGRLYAEVRAELGEAHARFYEDPVGNPIVGAESIVQMAERVRAALNDIAVSHPGGTVIVVTHGLPMAAVRCMVTSQPLKDVWRMLPDNAEVMCVLWPPDRR